MKPLVKIVIPQFAMVWEDVAYHLDYDIQTVETIRLKHHGNPVDCCDELFRDWLSTDHGVNPKSWTTLITRLKEIYDERIDMNRIEEYLDEFFLYSSFDDIHQSEKRIICSYLVTIQCMP